MWVHEVGHLLRDHHGRSDRVAQQRGLTGRGERLRMNIAADCEINDDIFGDGLVRPEGAVRPQLLGCHGRADGGLPPPVPARSPYPAPGLAGLRQRGRRRGPGLGPGPRRGARTQRRGTRRGPVPRGAGRHRPPGQRARRAGSVGPKTPSTRLSPGGTYWPRRSGRRSAVPGRARTTPTAGLPAGAPAGPASSCPVCAAAHRGSSWSSTRRGRSVTPSWAAHSSRSPPWPAPSAAGAT